MPPGSRHTSRHSTGRKCSLKFLKLWEILYSFIFLPALSFVRGTTLKVGKVQIKMVQNYFYVTSHQEKFKGRYFNSFLQLINLSCITSHQNLSPSFCVFLSSHLTTVWGLQNSQMSLCATMRNGEQILCCYVFTTTDRPPGSLFCKQWMREKLDDTTSYDAMFRHAFLS